MFEKLSEHISKVVNESSDNNASKILSALRNHILSKQYKVFGDGSLNAAIPRDAFPLAQKNGLRDFKNALEKLSPGLGSKLRPYLVFGKRDASGKDTYPAIKYLKLFGEVFGGNWYFDDTDLVKDDKTVLNVTADMTFANMFDKIAASQNAN